MRTSCLIRIFLRSLLIQSSFNFWRMQNLGFAFAMIPLIRQCRGDEGRVSRMLVRHLQGFNTHPYLSGPVIGSVVKLEETAEESHGGQDIIEVKNALMGPYAAIGDTFFWGAWRPFSVIAAVILAIEGIILAPILFLLIYNPLHFWVRMKGFIEGYRRGTEGIHFVSAMNLPGLAGKVRWLSLVMLGILAALVTQRTGHALSGIPEIITSAFALTAILLCFWIIKKGVSPIGLLYGMMALFTLVSL